MSKKNKDIIVLGFALFSMFFGAGNLIFPPLLGSMTSSGWLPAALGFVTTAVGLTMMGVVLSAKNPDNVDGFTQKVGPTFAKVLGVLCMLSVGPLLAIPRTAATTYEVAVVPILKNYAPPIIVSSIVFFAITLYFSLNDSSAMDVIGKFLTPVLITMVVLIIVKAVVTPIGDLKVVENTKFYLTGFKEGYQTMDALASMFLFSIVIESLKQRGYTEKNELFKISLKTGLLAGCALALVYIGLCYVGATSANVVTTTDRTKFLIESTSRLWGDFGAIALGLAMFMACLTTAIGLTCTVADYMKNIIPISYKKLCIIICVFSCITSSMGLEMIISVSVPILVTIYPLIIVLLVMNFFDKHIKNKAIYKGATLGAFLVSIVQALAIVIQNIKMEGSLGVIINASKFIDDKLPFASIGMPYIVPSFILAVIFNFAFFEKNE